MVAVKVLLTLWTTVRWPSHDHIQNEAIETLRLPSPMPGELIEDGGQVGKDSLAFSQDRIRITYILNRVLSSPISLIAQTPVQNPTPNQKALVEQVVARHFEEFESWAGQAPSLRPQSMTQPFLLTEGAQGVRRWNQGLIGSYSNIVLTLLRAALKNVRSTMQIRSSLAQAVLAHLEMRAPSEVDKITLFFDSLTWRDSATSASAKATTQT